jgi:glycosyltransferase involved in cell wall biosynthesis
MQKKKLLIIGLVWPEPTSSAAGTRMVQLIHFFLNQNYEIHFACAASKTEFSHDLIKLGVKEEFIKLNNESFNHYIKNLKPEIVLFDRYIIEEQYGWRVHQECPAAMTILDTEDLHFLRRARLQSTKKSQELDLFCDNSKREIASILRCDLSLIISEEEIKLLREQFKINQSLLFYLPFLEEEITETQINNWLSFSERADFIFIGNFLHEPNWHTVQYLKTEIWPILRNKLPQAKLNIYGAYLSQKVLQLNNPKENFNILGRAENAKTTIAKHKILLAPIQFGAGVKGKFIDAMHVGTPSVTTTIGAEAMKGDLEWNGFIEDDVSQFIDKAVELYQNEKIWVKAQQNGVQIINQRYSKNKFESEFNLSINHIFENLNTHRQQNFFGQILHYHTNQSTKYMSLWIEEKNKHLAPKEE